MQEEIDKRVIALVITSGKLTGRTLAKAMQAYLQHRHKEHLQIYKGKQTIKQLVESGAALSNIEITDKNIKSFEPIANKYGIDYAPKKDRSTKPPRHLVFFKGKDIDVITMAFQEYTQKMLRKKEKPSIRKLLVKLKEQAKQQSKQREKIKEKDRGVEL